MKTLGFVRVPVLLHDHYGSIEIDTSAPWWFRLWGKYLLAHYVGVYEKLGEWARSTGVPEERISVIGNALDLERVEREDAANIRAELRIEEGIPVGIVVCGLRWEKGIDLLLEAAARIADHLRFRIVLVGGARDAQYARSCRELRSTLGLEEKVIFLGERSNVPAILRDMDFALVPSRSESGPLVLIEYMAAGLPFVATRVGDISGRVEAAGIPGFVPPGEPASFAEALENLLELRPDARTRRGEIGRQMAFREFDIRSNIGKWYQTYSGVLEIS